MANLPRVPTAEIHAIDLSFSALQEKAMRECLNSQITSFVLPAQAADLLRIAARTTIRSSPESRRLLEKGGTDLVTVSGTSPAPPTAPWSTVDGCANMSMTDATPREDAK